MHCQYRNCRSDQKNLFACSWNILLSSHWKFSQNRRVYGFSEAYLSSSKNVSWGAKSAVRSKVSWNSGAVCRPETERTTNPPGTGWEQKGLPWLKQIKKKTALIVKGILRTAQHVRRDNSGALINEERYLSHLVWFHLMQVQCIRTCIQTYLETTVETLKHIKIRGKQCKDRRVHRLMMRRMSRWTRGLATHLWNWRSETMRHDPTSKTALEHRRCVFGFARRLLETQRNMIGSEPYHCLHFPGSVWVIACCR